MKFQNGEEVRDYLWSELNLSARYITFHMFETTDDSHVCVGGGIVDCSGDLYECSRFFDLGYDRADEAEIGIEWVESYAIGKGEAEHGDSDDAATLEDVANDSPSAFDEFIKCYADPLVSIKSFSVENPSYDDCSCLYDDDDCSDDE